MIFVAMKTRCRASDSVMGENSGLRRSSLRPSSSVKRGSSVGSATVSDCVSSISELSFSPADSAAGGGGEASCAGMKQALKERSYSFRETSTLMSSRASDDGNCTMVPSSVAWLL